MTPRVDRDLTQGSIARNIWHLALPLMVASALMDVFNIVDMIFVGRLGPEALAAVSMGGVLMGIVRMVAMGISAGTVALVSRYVGARDRERAQGVLGQSILMSCVGSAVIAVLGLLFSEPVLRLLGATEEVLPAGKAYLSIMCVGSITMFLSITLGAGMRGFGDAKTPMWALGFASLLNIGLDPLLIFGIGPFPRMEVAGSALATVLTRGIGAAILLAVLFRGRRGIKISLRLGEERFIGRIVRIGLFGALRMASMNISRVVLIRIVAVFGTYAVAAFGIGMRLRIFVLILGFGLADATAVLTGQNLGAGHPERAERGAWLSVGFFAVFLAAVSVAFLIVPRWIISVFNTHPEVLRMGTSYLYFFVPSLFLLDLSIVLGRAIDGSGNTQATMIITSVSLIGFGIPMAWWFSRLWGVNGVWAALVGSNMIQGLGVLWWFKRGTWKLQKV